MNFLSGKSFAAGNNSSSERINTHVLENVYCTVSLLQNKELLFRDISHS
jgi:hypothetical protein